MKQTIVGLAICLPCLVPFLIALGIGAGAFAAMGAWLSANGLVLGTATAAAVAFAILAGITYARRAKAAACDSDVEQAARTSRG